RPPRKGQAKARTRRSAAYAYAAGQHKRKTHRRPRVSRAVSRFLIDWPRRRQQFGEMSPVHEYEVDRPVLAMLNRQANEPLKEGGKLRFRHLARRDLELPRRRLCRRAKGRRAKQGRASWRPFPLPIKGAATRLPLFARVDGLEPLNTNPPAAGRQAIFLGATGPRAARPGKAPPRSDASRPRRLGGVNELVKYADIDVR